MKLYFCHPIFSCLSWVSLLEVSLCVCNQNFQDSLSKDFSEKYMIYIKYCNECMENWLPIVHMYNMKLKYMIIQKFMQSMSFPPSVQHVCYLYWKNATSLISEITQDKKHSSITSVSRQKITYNFEYLRRNTILSVYIEILNCTRFLLTYYLSFLKTNHGAPLPLRRTSYNLLCFC